MTEESHFLPGTYIQYAWDSTSLGWLKGCPRLYYYSMILNLQKKGENQSVHLVFGLEFHQALQDFDKYRSVGMDHDDATREIIKDTLARTHGWASENESKNRNTLIRTLVWYLDHYRSDPAKTVILDNGVPAVELSFKMTLDWGPAQPNKVWDAKLEQEVDNLYAGQPYLLCGHLDRVVDFNGDLFVMDRKTTKSTPSSWYYSQYSPDNQMSLYTIAAKVAFNTPVKGVIIDAAQITPTESRFGRGFTFRTENQSDEWLDDLHFWFTLAETFATTEKWPMNDKYCGTYRSEESGSIGCPFREVCQKDERVRDVYLKSNFEERKERWNPLKPR